MNVASDPNRATSGHLVLFRGAGFRSKFGRDAAVHASLWGAIVYGLAPSLAVAAFAAAVGARREYLINADYLLAAAIVSFISRHSHRWVLRTVATLLILALLSIDLLTIYLKSYFLSPAMIADTLPFILLWPWRSFLLPGVFAILTSVALVWLSLPARRSVRMFPAIALLVVAYGADVALGTAGLAQINIISSSTQNVLQPAVNHLRDRIMAKPIRMRPVAGDTLRSRLGASDLPRAIVSITVESLGTRRHGPQDWDALTQGLAPEYRLIGQTMHRFEGATLAGELRELCGVRVTGVPYTRAELGPLQRCLPRELASRGYRVTAYHGGDSWFYNRARVYEAVGFQQAFFFKDLAGQVRAPCAFLMLAICDADLVRLALASLIAGRPEFVHLMTIDTHLPVPPQAARCPTSQTIQECAYNTRMAASLTGIAAAVRNAAVKPDVIYVTGDHAPPFVDRRVADLFQPDVVPFLEYRRLGP